MRSWPARPLAWHRRLRVKLMQLLAGRDGVIINVRLPPRTWFDRDTPVRGGSLFVVGCQRREREPGSQQDGDR